MCPLLRADSARHGQPVRWVAPQREEIRHLVRLHSVEVPHLGKTDPRHSARLHRMQNGRGDAHIAKLGVLGEGVERITSSRDVANGKYADAVDRRRRQATLAIGPEQTKCPDLTDRRTKEEPPGATVEAEQEVMPLRPRPRATAGVSGIR
jgi:hypothetical protein